MEQIQGEYGSWVSVEMWNVEGRVERAGCREDLRQEQVVPCCTGVIPAEGQLRMRGHKVPMSAKDDPTRNGCGRCGYPGQARLESLAGRSGGDGQGRQSTIPGHGVVRHRSCSGR